MVDVVLAEGVLDAVAMLDKVIVAVEVSRLVIDALVGTGMIVELNKTPPDDTMIDSLIVVVALPAESPDCVLLVLDVG